LIWGHTILKRSVLTHTYHEMPGFSLPEFYSAIKHNVLATVE
jgi:hypothetical protein